MERRNGPIGIDVQPKLPVDAGKKVVELIQKPVIRMKRSSVPQSSQTEDAKQLEDSNLEPPRASKLVSKALEPKDPKREDPRLSCTPPQDPSPQALEPRDPSSEKVTSKTLNIEEPKTEKLKPEYPKPERPPPRTTDRGLDSLISLLDQTLKIEDKATTASRMVEVPSGYKLELENGIEDFYKNRAECKLVDKRKRAAGLLPMSTKRYQRYGFRPEELLAAGALYSPNAKPSNLTNVIHPFFHRSHFDDTPDIIYDQLVPGLRLATMFLTQPVCCQYWVTLAKGERKQDWSTSNRLGRHCLRISKDVPLTPVNANEVIEYIKKLDNASIIHITFKKDLYLHKPKDVLASTRGVCDVDFEVPHGLTFKPKRSHICLHQDFYTAANKLSKLKHPDPALVLRFHFFLACNLIHEIAHAVNLAHCYVRQTEGLSRGVDYNEPFLLDDTEPELGNAWENYMFGGRIAPINGRIDTSHGLSVCDWPFVGLTIPTLPIVGLPPGFRTGSALDGFMDDKQQIWHSMPMKFMENIQQMQTWEQPHDLATAKTRFHIRRSGAISISMNRFTTMPWAEELRIVSNSLADGFGISPEDDGDGRSAKKRETAKGKGIRTDVWGTKCNDEESERNEVKGEKGPAKPVKGSGLQGTRTKQRGHQSRHLRQVRQRNSEKRRRQEAGERRNAGPH